MNLFGFKKSSEPAAETEPVAPSVAAPDATAVSPIAAPPSLTVDEIFPGDTLADPQDTQLGALDATVIDTPSVVVPAPVVVPSIAPVAVSPVIAPMTDASAQIADVSLPVAMAPDPLSTPVAPVEPISLEPAPPRALVPGSFLAGEYEIKEVISRGAINFYLADASEYGAPDLRLVGERLAPSQRVETAVEADFFPPATRFVQDEREYAAWDFQNLKSLDDWNAQPNDETYLHVVGAVARGLMALESAALKPDLARESLFFDQSGELKSFGFFDVGEVRASGTSLVEAATAGLAPSSNLASSAGLVEVAGSAGLEEGASPATPPTSPSGMTAIHQLSALSSRFAKTNLAAGATLRLDDEFGALPFSQEVKAFARALNEGNFSSASQVVTALARFAPVVKTDAALLTDVGMEREINEDSGLIWKTNRGGHARNFALEVLAVADGMGGHEGGEVASDLTLSSLENALAKRQNLDFNDNAAVLSALNEVLGEVNDAVVRLTENPPYASMRAKPGSTLVCALRVGSRVFVGNVGDSRAYRWNADSGLQRLTKDHSYVQDLIDAGSLSEDQSWGHPDGSVITSHIGMMRGLKRDVLLRLLCPGDRLVLVSDGVVDTLRDPQIAEVIAANGEANALCEALVNAANDAGGFDNITVAALICA